MMTRTICLIACLLMTIQPHLAQSFGGMNPERLTRWRPLPPFDNDSGYRFIDALIRHSSSSADSTQSKSWMDKAGDILIGPEVALTPRLTLTFDGLIYIFNHSNSIDGAWLGYEVVGSYVPRPGQHLLLRVANNYTTRLHQWMNETHLLYYYAPARAALAVLSGGVTSRETAHISYEEMFATRWMAPIGTNNPLRIYRKTFAALRNSIDILPGLRNTLLLQYENRKPQWAHPDLVSHQAFVTEINLNWDTAGKLRQNPRYPASEQRPFGYFSPTLGMTYRVAIPLSRHSALPYSRYQLLEANIRHSFALSPTHRFHWGIAAGTYLDRTSVSPADERYMNLESPVGRLPIHTTWSTLPEGFTLGKRWMWGYLDMDMGNLLWSRLLPIDLDESFHLRGLRSSQGPWYEVGYSVGLGELMRAGLFGGSDFRHRHHLAVRLSLPLLLLLGKASSRY